MNGGDTLDPATELRRARPDARVALLPLPFDANASYERGTAAGPAEILSVLNSEAHGLSTEAGVDLEPLLVTAVPPTLPDRAGDAAFGAIQAIAAGLFASGLRPLAIGGDHSVTIPLLRACAARYSRLAIFHIDAHPDLYDEYDGNRYSHACPFARIMEEGLAARLVQVGIRASNAHLREQAERFGVESYSVGDLAWIAALEFAAPLYISIDLDGLDPAFAPGVSHPEPGGFSTREVLGMLSMVNADVIGGDIVEYNPGRDVGERTAFTAAKLVKELAGLMAAGSVRPR